MKRLQWVSLAALMVLLSALTACQKPLEKITVEDFRNDQETFVFKNLTWGMSKAEVELFTPPAES